MPITLVNFREGIAGDWIVEQCAHNIDKEIGIDKLNERFTFNITINYNNVFELEKETSKRNFEFFL